MTLTTLPTHKKGDTFPGVLFTMNSVVAGITSPIDLTDAHICMDLRTSGTSALILRLTNYDPEYPGLTITNPEAGEWKIDAQIIDIKPVTYVYDIQFTFPGATPVVKTLVEGTWTFTQDITHE